MSSYKSAHKDEHTRGRFILRVKCERKRWVWKSSNDHFFGFLKLLIFFTPRIKIDTTVLDRNAMPIIHIYTLRNNLPSTFFFAFIIIHTKTEQLRILGRASLKVEFWWGKNRFFAFFSWSELIYCLIGLFPISRIPPGRIPVFQLWFHLKSWGQQHTLWGVWAVLCFCVSVYVFV